MCVCGGDRGNLPCHVAYPMMHLMLLTPPPPTRQTPVKTLSTATSFVDGNNSDALTGVKKSHGYTLACKQGHENYVICTPGCSCSSYSS